MLYTYLLFLKFPPSLVITRADHDSWIYVTQNVNQRHHLKRLSVHRFIVSTNVDWNLWPPLYSSLSRMWFHRPLRADDWLLFVVSIMNDSISLSFVCTFKNMLKEVWTDWSAYCLQRSQFCCGWDVQPKGRGKRD